MIDHFDYAAIPQMRFEAREKLQRIKPGSLGQASRISGISPADLAVLLIYLDAPSSRADGDTSQMRESFRVE